MQSDEKAYLFIGISHHHPHSITNLILNMNLSQNKDSFKCPKTSNPEEKDQDRVSHQNENEVPLIFVCDYFYECFKYIDFGTLNQGFCILNAKTITYSSWEAYSKSSIIFITSASLCLLFLILFLERNEISKYIKK